jgi:dolichyl-phosphate beta-glucosyltransferase
MNRPYLSVVIPAYKEGERLPKTFPVFSHFVKKAQFKVEVIFVNDGSPDNTAEVIERLISKKNPEEFRLITYDKNRGKGYAVKRGFMAARGRYILFADADNATPIEQVDDLISFANEYDVIIGSRYLEKGRLKRKQSLFRIIGGRLLNFAIRIMTGLKLADTQCGFKLFESACGRKIFNKLTLERFSFDVEILAIGQKMGYKIKEVPVDWYDNPNSTVNPIKDGLRFLQALFIIRWNFLIGKCKIKSK